MAFVPIILAVASAAVAAYGAVQQGKAAQAQYKTQAQADKYNADVNALNANQALQEANAREEMQRRRGRAALGEQRAAIGENLGGFTGTSLGVIEQSGTQAELDALTERYGGQMESRGLLAQSELNKYQAKGALNAGISARQAGNVNAASSLLSSASSYYGGRRAG